MQKNQFFALVALTVALLSNEVRSETLVVTNATVVLYASTSGSPHGVQLSTLDGTKCHATRTYINGSDKEIFAMLMAAGAAGQKINALVETQVPDAVVGGHYHSNCRVVSVWR